MRKEELQLENNYKRKYDENFKSHLKTSGLQQSHHPHITALDGPPKRCLVVVIWFVGVDIIPFE